MRVAIDEVNFCSILATYWKWYSPSVHAEVGEDIIQIPSEYLVDTMDALINRVFPNIENSYTDKYFAARCAILTPKK